eukprot:1049-Heterococcus_DN1.PRE.3
MLYSSRTSSNSLSAQGTRIESTHIVTTHYYQLAVYSCISITLGSFYTTATAATAIGLTVCYCTLATSRRACFRAAITAAIVTIGTAVYR